MSITTEKLNKITAEIKELEQNIERIDLSLCKLSIRIGNHSGSADSVSRPVKFTEECNQELTATVTYILVKQKALYVKELERISNPLNIALKLSEEKE